MERIEELMAIDQDNFFSTKPTQIIEPEKKKRKRNNAKLNSVSEEVYEPEP